MRAAAAFAFDTTTITPSLGWQDSGSNGQIADLTALRRELAGVISSCAGGTMAERQLLQAYLPPLPARTGRA